MLQFHVVRLQVSEETPGVRGSFGGYQTTLLRDMHAAYRSHQVHGGRHDRNRASHIH